MSLVDLAARVVERAKALGAEQAVVGVTRGTHTQIIRRGGKVESATEATSRGLSLSVLVNDRWTSNSTSDLREEALETFLRRSVEAAGVLEPDPDRRLPDPAECGRGATEAELDLDDPAWAARTAEERARDVEALEETIRANPGGDVISSSAWVSDGRSEGVRVTSDGFADSAAGGWFAAGGEMTLRDGDRRPEASAGYTTRYLADLPGADVIARDLAERARERIGAGPMESGTYTMVVNNRVAGRILGLILGPITGGALHEGRSCLHDKLGQRIASPLLTIVDDPLRPRGLSSHAWDGDGRRARAFDVVRDGVLQTFYLNTYYARKLGRPATTGGRSNWVLPAGDRPVSEICADRPKAILVTGFLGGNSNPVTGDFSFGISGMLLENGKATRPLAEMNVAGNTLELFEQLTALGNDPWPWSSTLAPSLVFDGVQFSGR